MYSSAEEFPVLFSNNNSSNGVNRMTDSTDFFGPPIWPPFEALQDVLERWSAEHSELMDLQVRGQSREGRPVYAIRLTDPNTSDKHKENVFISALHSGGERTGTATVFYLMEWMLSGDPLAAEILRTQNIICMPVPNPDDYLRGDLGYVYSEWNLKGPKDPENMPEGMAVKEVMDELQPDVHADIHGLTMNFTKYIMLENSGSSYSNLGLRCYHREIIRQMDAAALAEGYPSDRQESDSERIYWGPELEEMSAKVWIGRPRVFAATYCYNLFHSILSAVEVSWERSGFLRHRRLLEIGNELWPGEYYPGYPNRVILSNGYHMVTAWGKTASDRRRSRIELWNRVGQIACGMADPMCEGRIVYVCTTSSQARSKWLGDVTLDGFAGHLADHPQADHESIKDFVAGWPAGQNHPKAWLALFGEQSSSKDLGPVQHGLALRLRIPFTKAQITDLRLNGHPVAASETDGFMEWKARGYTYVQINIPPGRSQTEDLYVVTCAYEPGDVRTHWGGWRKNSDGATLSNQ
ncbi:MAG TPA: hypothetical protein EYO78_01170 [Gammaproteobacteria bacterium]|nr:hypothetical protein [Gammaproteobacteria bacterium]